MGKKKATAPPPTLPRTLPAEARELLSHLLQSLHAPDTEESAAGVVVCAVGLLLPRYAGTMLKLLSERPLPADELLRRSAASQGQEPGNPDVQFRLALALEYLKRTGCAEPVASRIQATPFGEQVYLARFKSQ